MAGTLSGGQKRRLCVGISTVGGNSVVYLDEPTAGLDPVSRRQLGDLVKQIELVSVDCVDVECYIPLLC
jgi:ABC-type multidrug transport system ATPase subunit